MPNASLIFFVVGFLSFKAAEKRGVSIQGRDGALRRPRRVQRRIGRRGSNTIEHSFSPLNTGWDGAARHPYLVLVEFRCA
jgi:hypothetical protein